MSAWDVENQISRTKIIQFDGVDVSRRPKCDCNHDYDFQYFFFTEVSRGASRILFLILSILHKNRSKTMKLQINNKNVPKNTYYVQILACIMWRF